MTSHRFDPLSFVFGIVFVSMALAAANRDRIDWDLGVWIFPVAVLMLGIGLLASAIRGTTQQPTDEDDPAST